MLIEFIGISGSGKSTIARSVTKALKAEGFLARHVGSGYEWVEGSRACERLRDATANGIRGALRTAQLATVVKNAGRNLRLKEQLSLLSLLGQNSRALQSDAGLVLSDQGLLQRLGSFALRTNDEVLFFAHLKPEQLVALPWPDRVVFLELASSVALERVKARGGRMARLSDQELRGLLNRSQTIVEAQAQLGERLGIPVERVRAYVPPGDIAEALFDQLIPRSESGV